MPETAAYYMNLALEEAARAAGAGEVPIGAVVVSPTGEVIGRGSNVRESLSDLTGHAEVAAARKAAAVLGTWRLDGCDLYVTLEPCFMCASALQQARIHKVWYGAADPKAGALESRAHFYDEHPLNHYVEAEGGVLGEECSALLKRFFRELRARNRSDNRRFGGRAHRSDAARQMKLRKPGHQPGDSE